MVGRWAVPDHGVSAPSHGVKRVVRVVVEDGALENGPGLERVVFRVVLGEAVVGEVSRRYANSSRTEIERLRGRLVSRVIQTSRNTPEAGADDGSTEIWVNLRVVRVLSAGVEDVVSLGPTPATN